MSNLFGHSTSSSNRDPGREQKQREQQVSTLVELGLLTDRSRDSKPRKNETRKAPSKSGGGGAGLKTGTLDFYLLQSSPPLEQASPDRHVPNF